MIKKYVIIILMFFMCLITFTGCNEKDDKIYGGYYEVSVTLPKNSNYYISGYQGGRYYTDVLDYQKAKAFYLKYHGEEVLLITIDCVGLTSEYVNLIRGLLNLDFPVNVISTHTHAGVDTMGLWGPVGIDGKSDTLMMKIVDAAVEAGEKAYSNSTLGSLSYGYTKTENILRDSREPLVYDENIYQLRFIPSDNSSGTRLVFYGAHAESLGGENTKISADFPGVMSSVIKEQTGENMMYFPGAIGGLICTQDFDPEPENNMRITGEKLATYVLSIKEEDISQGKLKQSSVNFKIRLDNTIFMYYKFLGILENEISKSLFSNTYYIRTELTVIQIDNVTLCLLPGEIFPELVWGGAISNDDAEKDLNDNPDTLMDIALEYNVDNLIIVGLANDEIGYIIPPSDFLVDDEYPYIVSTEDYKGENHYEETMSVGIKAASKIANAFNKCLRKL